MYRGQLVMYYVFEFWNLQTRVQLLMPFGTAIDGGAAILTKAVLRWRRVRGTIRDDGTGTTGQGRPGT
ncbi:MAG TPA: hypothetical protein VFC78_01655 [Tepidisphaeraceae bacterium]|nr:hypothetical protein [Tepidisphaeraceae bacterium]